MFHTSTVTIATTLLSLMACAVTGEYYLCNVCQNSDHGERYLYDRSESFINPSTNQRWTCGDLQDAVQDVDPTSSGASGEAYLCAVYQVYAEMHCTCMGPEVPSLLDGPYKDINPSCDLCRGYAMSYVPTFRSKQTVDAGTYGNQNCLGLYEAALTGNVLSSAACEEIHDVYEDCCSLPDLPGEHVESESNNNGGKSPSAAPPMDPSSKGSKMGPAAWLLASSFLIQWSLVM
ncbi:hypothetical protein IV203_033798 [Nitzschia inconspicua]|uniref:Folate receptor-like domain-containing protein n=1 Tax=Nitzschia inconspicua TaxID=303405 RepID=A0A9K3M3G6_9STRA|nr:hypothetical protein IV203_033798 [Nitzschia inconspicua]